MSFGPCKWEIRYNKSFPERLFDKIGGDRLPWECWPWLAGTIKSHKALYGQISLKGAKKHVLAHRAAWEFLVGPIPQRLTIDHLCHNTLCCNPYHMELVTSKENLLRGNAISAQNRRKTHCPQGHLYDPENTYLVRRSKTPHRVDRTCRICNRAKRHLRYLKSLQR
jgi:hypothetical protein